MYNPCMADTQSVAVRVDAPTRDRIAALAALMRVSSGFVVQVLSHATVVDVVKLLGDLAIKRQGGGA